MKKKKTVRDHAKAAADARSDLNIFYAVIALMESSLLSSASYTDEATIVRICKRAGARCLARMDRALERIPAP